MRKEYDAIGGGEDDMTQEIILNINEDVQENHLESPPQRICSLCDCFSTFFAATSGWGNIFQNQKTGERSLHDSPRNSR